ncbi:MAG: CRISPR-associated endonuclease Cas2 [Puniceicoccaceae bacterium]
MYLVLVYDTDKKNCAKLHKALKRHLHWNQRSVFEGQVTPAQLAEIKHTIHRIRHPKSHIVFYQIENEKMLKKEELGEGEGNTGNII